MGRVFTGRAVRPRSFGATLMAFVVVLAAFTPFVVGLAGAQTTEPTPVGSCLVISAPGTYIQTADITAAGDCIVVDASDVTFDGNGYAIAGDGTGVGIRVDGQDVDLVGVDVSEFEDAILFDPGATGSVSDSVLTGNEYGIDTTELVTVDVSDSYLGDNRVGVSYGPVSNGEVTGNVFESNSAGVTFLDTGIPSDVRENTFVDNRRAGVDIFMSDAIRVAENDFEGNDVGVVLDGGVLGSSGNDVVENTFRENRIGVEVLPDDGESTGNRVARNVIVDSGEAGIALRAPGQFGEFSGNEFFDNLLGNRQNVLFAPGFDDPNTWSLPAGPGPNVVGGPSVGGNFYAVPVGEGFSQTCTDADGDGFCDTPNALGPNNVDSAPLVESPEVSACRLIWTPGSYTQTTDLVASGDCVEIRATGVTYDGNGHSITGDGTGTGLLVEGSADIEHVEVFGFDRGVYFLDPAGGSVDDSVLRANRIAVAVAELVDVAVSRTHLVDNARGISYGPSAGGPVVGNTLEGNRVGVSFEDTFGVGEQVHDNTFVDNELGVSLFMSDDIGVVSNVFETNDVGVRIEGATFGSGGNDVLDNDFRENGVGVEFTPGDGVSSGNVVARNTIVDSIDAGILVGAPGQFGALSGNELSDNYLENTVNVRFAPAFDGGANPNTWSVPASPGPNVVGGPSLGGNYYATPTGDGFSQTCTDADADGFCDAPNVLFEGNVDELPLVKPAPTAVSACQVISTPGRYVQTTDLSTSGDCIVVRADGVSYDGAGYTISQSDAAFSVEGGSLTVEHIELRGNDVGVSAPDLAIADVHDSVIADNGVGVYYASDSGGVVRGSSVENNGVGIVFIDTTVAGRNVLDNTIVGNDVGVELSQADLVGVLDNSFETNGVGVRLDGSSLGTGGHDIVDNRFDENGVGIELLPGDGDVVGNHITGNRITDSSVAGLVVASSGGFGTVTDNDVFDNAFENAENVRFDPAFDASPNRWNLPSNPGPNVVGGPSLGGNYYATPAGDGFSQTCTDADGDGFCDAPNSLFANNVDELPLVRPASGAVTVTACQVITAPGRYVQTADLSAAGDCIIVETPDVTFDGNGHTITGDGSGAGIAVEDPSANAVNVVITGVDVSEFAAGISFDGGGTGSVEDSVVRANDVGVDIRDVFVVDVRRTHVVDNRMGVDTGPDSSGTFVGNTFENNENALRYGDYAGNGDQVRQNTFVDNGVGVDLVISDDIGVVSNVFETNDVGVRIEGQGFGSFGNEILDNDFTENGVGIELRPNNGPLNGNVVSRNRIVDSTDAGILVIAPDQDGEVSGNEISDNYLENDENVRFDPAFDGSANPNTWNVPASPGPNIVGGPSVGGNYYATPAGDGFSQTCTDVDGDGFCDAPNSLLPGNVDELPLVATTDGGISFPPGFFVESDCTGVVTLGSLAATFGAGFDDGRLRVSMLTFSVGQLSFVELAQLLSAATLTDLELSCTATPVSGDERQFDFDLSEYEGREVGVCIEQADGTVTCVAGPVDEDGWHPENLDRTLLFALSVLGGNTPVDAMFFPSGLPDGSAVARTDATDDRGGRPAVEE